MSISNNQLEASLRRETDLVWPGGSISESEGKGLELVNSLDRLPFSSLHPRQSDLSLSGALALVSELDAILKTYTGFDCFSWGYADMNEAWQTAEEMAQKWRSLRRPLGPSSPLLIHAEGEPAPDFRTAGGSINNRLSAEVLKSDLSKLDSFEGTIVFITAAAVERLGYNLEKVVKSCHSGGSLCGPLRASMEWIASGFIPTEVGFDFAVVDLGSLSGINEPLAVLACSTELELFLPQPRWTLTEEGYRLQPNRVHAATEVGGPIVILSKIASCYATLRLLGTAGLKKVSQLAAINAAYVYRGVATLRGGAAVGSSFHEVWAPGISRHFILHGKESDVELERMAAELGGS